MLAWLTAVPFGLEHRRCGWPHSAPHHLACPWPSRRRNHPHRSADAGGSAGPVARRGGLSGAPSHRCYGRNEAADVSDENEQFHKAPEYASWRVRRATNSASAPTIGTSFRIAAPIRIAFGVNVSIAVAIGTNRHKTPPRAWAGSHQSRLITLQIVCRFATRPPMKNPGREGVQRPRPGPETRHLPEH